MSKPEVYSCQCPDCHQKGEHPHKKQHHKMNLFLSRLNEQQKRWYVALESQKMGHGGDKRLAIMTGMDEKTISKGRQEMESDLSDRPVEGIRKPGAGRHKVEKKALKSSRF